MPENSEFRQKVASRYVQRQHIVLPAAFPFLRACFILTNVAEKTSAAFPKLRCPLCGLLLATTAMQGTGVYYWALLPHQCHPLFLRAALLASRFKRRSSLRSHARWDQQNLLGISVN